MKNPDVQCGFRMLNLNTSEFGACTRKATHVIHYGGSVIPTCEKHGKLIKERHPEAHFDFECEALKSLN